METTTCASPHAEIVFNSTPVRCV